MLARLGMLRLAIAWLVLGAAALCADEPEPAFDYAAGRFALDGFAPAQAKLRDAQTSPLDGRGFTLATGHRDAWPGVTFEVPSPGWDLGRFAELTAEVANVGTETAQVGVRLDDPTSAKENRWIQTTAEIAPGAKAVLRLAIARRWPADAPKLFGMRGLPFGAKEDGGLDASQVTQMQFFVAKPSADHRLEIAAIRLTGTAAAPFRAQVPADRFFPLIDRFGQFVHADWPGKVRDQAELVKAIPAEAADLEAHPAPGDWDRYGGWAAGPQLEATGFFRTARHAGKWWLVDPEGRLFWSHGADCVQTASAATPITDRESWFAELPEKDAPLAQFYGTGNWAPHGYYQGRGEYRTYNFTGANLFRKYGEAWRARSADLAHRRLRSWGMNTIANWSDRAIAAMKRTAYVATVGGSSRPIEGSEGYWGKFPDPFDPGFREALDRAMAREKDASAGDPWCIGYFVGNELSWGEDLSLARAALASPADQPAKRAFADALRAKYETIERLNAAWGTGHATWESLLESRTPPEVEKARVDLAHFHARVAEEYFRQCRDAVKAVAPRQLYLGCRFAWVNEPAVRAAAGFCDVISFNRYQESLDGFRMPEGVDRPAIIGEFHFGALDRGMFHTGLCPTASQTARAAAYRRYVGSALAHPAIVGTHWFQYGDQATTGRGDGENYQIGLIDVCDTPYPETIAAVRAMGYGLYRTRLGEEGGKEP